MSDTEETKTVGVRFPVDLIRWIDHYCRIVAFNEERRVTRNEVIIGFIEDFRSVIEKTDKSEWRFPK